MHTLGVDAGSTATLLTHQRYCQPQQQQRQQQLLILRRLLHLLIEAQDKLVWLPDRTTV